jgi:hypothetical protein
MIKNMNGSQRIYRPSNHAVMVLHVEDSRCLGRVAPSFPCIATHTGIIFSSELLVLIQISTTYFWRLRVQWTRICEVGEREREREIQFPLTTLHKPAQEQGPHYEHPKAHQSFRLLSSRRNRLRKPQQSIKAP